MFEEFVFYVFSIWEEFGFCYDKVYFGDRRLSSVMIIVKFRLFWEK